MGDIVLQAERALSERLRRVHPTVKGTFPESRFRNVSSVKKEGRRVGRAWFQNFLVGEVQGVQGFGKLG